MRNFYSLFLCSLFFLSSSFELHAAPNIATVVKMRGSVTKLLPHMLEAMPVSPGDQFPQDTSIVTGPKSFIKIKFVDNSELNMGPESKIVISEMAADSAGVISLLKGRIRTEVQKTMKPSEEGKNKFYIRTRTAAMGVRGTDFQTIYNPDNRVTSLLTYKGAVAMAQIDESAHKRFEESTTVVERIDLDHAPEVKQIPGKMILEKELMTNVLNGPDTVVVPPGQNAFTSSALHKSSLPVKISEVQLNALYKNRDFEEKNIVNLKSGLDVKNPKMEIAVAPQVAPTEGFYDSKSGDFAPRAGGLIDQRTGLYIAPDASSGILKTGDFDKDTGDYFAPQGLTLDAKRGFVLDKNADAKPELLAMREDMNKAIARDTVVGDLDGEVKLKSSPLSEKFIRHRLTFGLKSGSQNLDLAANNGSNPTREVKSSSAWDFSVLWQVPSSNRFSPLLGVNFGQVDFGDLAPNGDSQDSAALYTLTTGLKYALTNRVDLISLLLLDQNFYANQTTTSPNAYTFKKIVMTRLKLGAEAEIMRSDEFSLMGQLYGTMAFRKKYNSQIVSEITGFNLRVTPQYQFAEKQAVGLGLYLNSENSTIVNSLGSTEQKRSESGLELKYVLDI